MLNVKQWPVAGVVVAALISGCGGSPRPTDTTSAPSAPTGSVSTATQTGSSAGVPTGLANAVAQYFGGQSSATYQASCNDSGQAQYGSDSYFCTVSSTSGDQWSVQVDVLPNDPAPSGQTAWQFVVMCHESVAPAPPCTQTPPGSGVSGYY